MVIFQAYTTGVLKKCIGVWGKKTEQMDILFYGQPLTFVTLEGWLKQYDF